MAHSLDDLDSETREYLTGTSLNILLCRHHGHCWQPLNDGEYREVGTEWVQEVRCFRCGTVGVDAYTPWTLERKGSRRYTHCEGYLQAGLSIPRTNVRVFLALRAREAMKKKSTTVTRGGGRVRGVRRSA